MVSDSILVCLSSICLFSLNVNGQCPTTSTTPNSTTTTSPPYGDCEEFPCDCSSNYTVNPAGFNYSGSPFWDMVLSVGGDHAYIDNVCNTYMLVGDNCYVYFRSVTYHNKTVVIKKTIYAPLPQDGAWKGLGVQRPTGCDSCVYNDYVLGQPYKGCFVIYRCYLYGPCVPQFDSQDQLFGFAMTPTITEDAKEALIEFFGGNKYIVVPNLLPSSCVVRVGDTPVYGADRVPCENRITVP